MLINHARTAVERTARSLASMRARFETPGVPLGHQHRLLIDGALRDLGRRHASLTDLYQAMLAAPADQLTTCWQRFFACYDDYLEAVRDTRCRLIQDENEPSDQDDPTARP